MYDLSSANADERALDKYKDHLAVDIIDELLGINGLNNLDLAKEILKAVEKDVLKQLLLKYLGE